MNLDMVVFYSWIRANNHSLLLLRKIVRIFAQNSLSRLAKRKGIGMQPLIRAIIIPDWVRTQESSEKRSRRRNVGKAKVHVRVVDWATPIRSIIPSHGAHASFTAQVFDINITTPATTAGIFAYRSALTRRAIHGSQTTTAGPLPAGIFCADQLPTASHTGTERSSALFRSMLSLLSDPTVSFDWRFSKVPQQHRR
jgi:hypothetical protein